MPSCFILRGVSGCGKSTLAEEMAIPLKAAICSADDYFYDHGIYKFDASRLNEAHSFCYNNTKEWMRRGVNVIVDNTNTTEWEVNKYRDLALSNGYQVFVITAENWHEGQNTHNVPEETLDKMRERLKQSIKL